MTGVKHRHISAEGETVHRHNLLDHTEEEWVTAYPVRTRGRRAFAKAWTIITKGSHARHLAGQADRLEKP